MDRKTLKYTLLAAAERIFSSYSTEELEDALAHFSKGGSIHLYPHKVFDLDDYDAILPKIKRAFKPKSFISHNKKDRPSEAKPMIKMVQLDVPLSMDLSKLSKKEKSVLLRHLDMPVLMTCNQIKRTKTEFSCVAKIGIKTSYLHQDHRSDPDIAQYIQSYHPQDGYFMNIMTEKTHTENINLILNIILKRITRHIIPFGCVFKPP